MTDYASFKFGNVVYPLTASTSNSLLKDADPTIYYLLDFVSAMITTYAGSRLTAQSTAVEGPVTTPVAMAVGYDPSHYLEETYFKFPLLAIYRRKRKLDYKSTTWRQDISDISIDYILPPFSAAEAENLLPILRAVSVAIDIKIEQGWDPSYTPPGGSAGDKIFGSSYANIVQAGILTDSYGAYAGINENVFFAYRADLEVIEKSALAPNTLDVFAGADATVDLADADGTTVQNIARISTQSAPTITSLDVSTGTISGGTSITITGTLFQAPATVTIGGVACTNVVVVNSTSITCTTGAHPNPGDVDVVVTNTLDGQYDTLADGFTYTA